MTIFKVILEFQCIFLAIQNESQVNHPYIMITNYSFNIFLTFSRFIAIHFLRYILNQKNKYFHKSFWRPANVKHISTFANPKCDFKDHFTAIYLFLVYFSGYFQILFHKFTFNQCWFYIYVFILFYEGAYLKRKIYCACSDIYF